MSRNSVSRALDPRGGGSSLVARLVVVVVTILVATSTFAGAVAVAAPGGGDVATDASPATAVDTSTPVPDSAGTIEQTAGGTHEATIEDADLRTANNSVDVVFIVDSSLSMNDERYQLAGEMREFQRTLIDKNIDARFGLVTYTKDATVRQSFTSDFSKVEDAMQFETGGNVERASNAILTASEMDFRPDAEPVYVLLTNEDDDSSSALRQRALDRLAQGTFVSISPSKAVESSCDRHIEPCDNSTSNELRQYAEQVDGAWVTIDESASKAMRQAATSAAEAAGTGSDGGPGIDDVDAGPNVSVIDRSADETNVEVGEPVTVSATLRNSGLLEGSFEVFLSESGQVLERKTVTVAERSERTVTITREFDEPGEYALVLNNERVANVEVTAINETSVRLTTTPERNRLLAQVSDATEEQGVDIDVPSSSLLSTPGADLRRITVTPAAGMTTPKHDVAFDLAVERTTAPPSDAPELNTTGSAVTYLSVTSTLAESELSSVEFQYANTSADIQMYRYDTESGEWVTLSQEAISEKSLVATTGELSAFAVVIDGPAVAVESVRTESTDVTVGDSVTATVTVRNRGTETKSYDATVSLDGEIVASERVRVPAGETADVTVEYVPSQVGQYSFSVAGTDQGQLDVASAPTTTDTETTTASDATTAATTTTADANGSTPGFTAFATLLILLVLSLYAVRRR
jgi:hypothetical protein